MRTVDIILCALFAALTAVLSQVAIPVGPVPINLATFAVFCAGAMLGAKRAAISLGLYAALGTVGVPVFAMFRSGLTTLAGPTGGYILGYIPAAFLIGWILERGTARLQREPSASAEKKRAPYVRHTIAMLWGMLVYFTAGTAWFMFSTQTGLIETLGICVLPFIPGDLLKIGAAATLSVRLRKGINK